MSRTFKDRPYWVRANDVNTEGREVHHDHTEAGKPIYGQVPVLDDEGNPVYSRHETIIRDVGARVILKNGTSLDFLYKNNYRGYSKHDHQYLYGRYYQFRNELRARYGAQLARIEDITESHVIKTVKTETEIVAYRPDYCTAGIPQDGNSVHFPLRGLDTHLCTTELAYRVTFRYYNYPSKEQAKQYHGGARVTEHAETVRMKNMFNSDPDIDLYGDEFENIYTRPHNRIGWWD